MAFLRTCLDDADAVACGRCDRCSTPRFTPEVSAPALAAAHTFLGRPGLQVEPRRMWPTGLKAAGVPLAGRISLEEQAQPGRAVGRLTDLGWGTRLRTLLAEDAPDAPASADLLAAIVEVLKAWATGPDPWQQRPVGVVAMGSTRRSQLIASVAEHVSAVGRLPLLGMVKTPPSTVDAGRANSAHRVRALYGSMSVPTVSGPVLLIDDFVDSGWTMALAARELRLAGASAVLPLALALTS